MKNFYPSFSARRTPLIAVAFELGVQRHIVKPITKRELKSETFLELFYSRLYGGGLNGAF